MNLSNKMVKGMVWSMLERLSVQGIQFILGIILARILSPTEFEPKITEQHITGSFVEIFDKYNISRVVSISIKEKIKI